MEKRGVLLWWLQKCKWLNSCLPSMLTFAVWYLTYLLSLQETDYNILSLPYVRSMQNSCFCCYYLLLSYDRGGSRLLPTLVRGWWPQTTSWPPLALLFMTTGDGTSSHFLIQSLNFNHSSCQPGQTLKLDQTFDTSLQMSEQTVNLREESMEWPLTFYTQLLFRTVSRPYTCYSCETE